MRALPSPLRWGQRVVASQAATISHLPHSLVQANPAVAMDCIIQMAQHITRAQKAQVAHLLSTVDSESPS